MTSSGLQYIRIQEIDLLPENPRTITKSDFQRLVDSIKINGFWEHRPLALVRRGERLVVLAGNQRLKAARKLKLESLPCVVYSDTTKDEELDIIARDNINNGDWDFIYCKPPRNGGLWISTLWGWLSRMRKVALLKSERRKLKRMRWKRKTT